MNSKLRRLSLDKRDPFSQEGALIFWDRSHLLNLSLAGMSAQSQPRFGVEQSDALQRGVIPGGF